MENNFLKFVAKVLEKKFDEINMESSCDKGDWTSLMHIVLVAEISAEYGVDIPIDEVPDIHTLGDFCKYVNK